MRRWWRQTAAVAVAAATVAAAAGAAEAAPGDLDASFGAAGTVAGIAGLPEDVIVAGDRVLTLSATTINSDPTILHVRAFTLSGAPDTSFSGDGVLDLSPGMQVTTGELAVDGSGRVLIAIGGIGGAIGQKVLRLTAAGATDTSFDGDGTVTFSNLGLFSQVNGLGVQPDGDIVVGLNDSSPFGGLSQFPQLVRLSSTGAKLQTVDVLSDYASYGALADVVVDGSGRPHVVLPVDGKLTVRRYTDALALDTAFSGDGIAQVVRPGGGDDDNRGGAISVDASGRVLVAGTVAKQVPQVGPPTITENATIVGRLTSAGAADTSFSGDGIAVLSRPAGKMISPLAVHPTALGGAIVAADQTAEGGETISGLVWELTTAGAASTGFSGDGRLELSGWPLSGTTAANGGRFLLYGSSDAGTEGNLRSIQLSTPAAPAAPATPTVTGGSATTANVAFVLPADGGSVLTGVTVRAYAGADTSTIAGNATAGLAGATPGQTIQLTVVGLTPGTRYRFRAFATNAVGDGAASALSGFALLPFTSVDRFVQQQYADLISRPATSTELADLRGRIQAGTTTPAAAIEEVAAKPEWATLDPLTRIYYAYFGRTPDTGGLTYWLGKRRSGTKVSEISNQFAASNEFKTKYGSLSNRAFVELVYQNVLGRTGDAAGIASWTAKLDAKTKTRGEVMVQFSESSEHKRRRAGEVNTVSVIFGMLKRAPRAADLTTWVPQVKASKQPLIVDTLSSAAYDARIPSA